MIGLVTAGIAFFEYAQARRHLQDTLYTLCSSKVSEITTLSRYHIVTGDIAHAYDDIERIAHDNNIVSFRIETPENIGNDGRNITTITLPANARFTPLDTATQMYNDMASEVLFLKRMIYFDEQGTHEAGHVLIGFSYKSLTAQLHMVRNRFLGLLVMLCGTFLLAFEFARRGFNKNYEQLLTYFFALSQTQTPDRPESLKEYTPLLERAERMSQEIITSQRLATDAAVGAIARQAAHDIRSPLTALKVVSGHLAELPEDKRVMIRNAVQRIDDIANDLAGKKSADNSRMQATEQGGVSIQLISSLLEPLISEKRIQFRSQLGIGIHCSLDANAYGAFARVQSIELKRAISNLVNNAVEAMHGDGAVTVGLTQTSEHVRISVTDTGQGIPPELLPQLMRRGATFGKAQGSGLGLYHAKTTVELWGGTLELTSIVGQGTSVIIVLPRTDPPHWFVPELALTSNSTIVIVDDDASIHHVWDERLSMRGLNAHNIQVQHFSSGADVIHWYQQHASAATLFLCDYELLGDQKNGLDLIEQLAVQSHAILVTSRYEESDIQARCARLGVRLIPKGLAGSVPIQLHDPKYPHAAAATHDGYHVLLIDDNDGIRFAWQMEQERLGIHTLLAFASFEDCESAAPDYGTFDFAFVDKHIDHSAWRVDQVIAALKSRGVKRVLVASGETAEALANDPLCAQADGVVEGKIPHSLENNCGA